MTSTTEVQQLLDDRYGRTRRRWPRVVAALALVAAVAGVVWYGWGTVTSAMDSVDVDVTGFTVVDPHTVDIDVRVTLRPGAPVACALEAQDTEHGIVGFRVVEHPASDAHTRAFSATIPTVAEATTGLVTSCWIP